ncbi:hypothetical protein NEMIN01_1915 [Nematocida minor]|uniref:uncharacterized protein n=1 Tax=Nematocida minor TaxID=1912983 RepID=UPI00221FCDC7|nr:uncharacterized protein NEMIN01_1915 [Nematocida minor]KAI5192263.1 hypothetical protein NEMIN01_1915 [Nematocida minor]
MSIEHEDVFTSQDKTVLSADCSDIVILEYLSKAPFVTHEEIVNALKNIDSERLETIAKYNPSIIYTIYDVLLLRSSQSPEACDEGLMENAIFTSFATPRTPYSMWNKDALRFTSLDLKTAQKLSAILRGKYNEIKPHEIMDLLRRLEHMCSGNGFSMQEKSLALALLNITAIERNISPRYILHICCLMKTMRYPTADTTLLEYFEREDPSIGECAVISSVKERRKNSHWCVKLFLEVYTDRVLSVFYKIKETLEQFIKEKDIDRVVELLTSIYMYSNDEKMEDTIFTSFGEDGKFLLEMCKEHIWN